MGTASGYILKLNNKHREQFEHSLDIYGSFAEAVDEFSFSRKLPLICFITDSQGRITHLASGKRGRRAGTKLSRLNCKEIIELEKPIRPGRLIKAVDSKVRFWIKLKLKTGGLLSPKSFESFVDSFIEISPESKPFLERYGKVRRERINRLTARERYSLATQKETVATALAISDMDREELTTWTLSNDDKPRSFLEGLSVARMREDPMVNNDLMVLPGHAFVKQMMYGAAVFQGDESRLTVILANRQPLEQSTGTDLIYFNETFQAFIMVQYKAMEQESKEAVFRFPNRQLTEEIKRMDSVLAELQKVPPDSGRDNFRLSQNPFFLKFCPRLLFNPYDTGLVPGMYLPLDYWKHCENDPVMEGPKGGKKLTYKNVGRYFNNSSFVHIVSRAWVGTTLTQSTILERIIRETIEIGKAVTIAIKRDDRDTPDDDGQDVRNPLTDGAFMDQYEPPIQQTVVLKA